MNDLLHGLAGLEHSASSYDRAEGYYNGTIGEVFASARICRQLEKTGEHYRVNFAKTPVDAIASRLEISAVTTKSAGGQVVLDEIWKDNDLLLESPILHRKALMYGDAYLMVWPSLDETGVDTYYNSPLTTAIVYEAENPRVKAYAIKRWQVAVEGGKPTYRVNLYYADRTQRWVSKPGVKGNVESDWLLMDETPNPYGEIPVFHFRTDRPFGRPVHRDAYGPQDMINKLVATQMASVDFQGFPQRYALLGQETSEDAGDFNDTDPDFTTDTGQQVENPSGDGFRASPGGLWYMRGVESVGQFATADPKNFMEPLEIYVRAMSQVTNTPLHYFDPAGATISGESRRAAEAPLVKIVGTIEQMFARTWADAFEFGLKIEGVDNASVDVRWAPSESTDDKDGWEVVALKIANGVPHGQALMEAGYTPEQAAAWAAVSPTVAPVPVVN